MADGLIWKSDVTLQVAIKLNESEARALEAIGCYGSDQFLQFFYEKLGTSNLKPHEVGLRSLFDAVRKDIRPILARADEARKAFNPPPRKQEAAT